ncbi:MAG TPA: FAD-dependent oxidoreductase [Usitatibacteraceae bacterium]|nr:FAD-dependent oxidoreductase [Usitatibacteraceae bacterium]
MTIHDVTLAAREEVAEGTMAFHFAKPAGFVFKPGQAIDLILPGLPDANGQPSRHAFSIVSAPFERDLVVATRMRDSAFKRALGAMPIGAPVQVDGPFGSLTLHNDRARAAVFIAGGIGITPFMSMLRHAAADPIPRSLTLLYSNRRPEDAAFLAELQQLEKRNRNFRLVATMTAMARSGRPWEGEVRLIDADLVRKVSAGLTTPVYYLVGPPALVEGLRKALGEAQIDDDDVRSEEFYGY